LDEFLFDTKRSLMDIEGIREALRRQPFEPFAFRLADGRSLPVPHPEMVVVGKRHIIVVEADDSGSVVEPLLIVSLDYSQQHGQASWPSYRPR
jgi:hypothetical protein